MSDVQNLSGRNAGKSSSPPGDAELPSPGSKYSDIHPTRLEPILDATVDAIAAVDRNWNFTYFNRQARRLLAAKGYLIGRNLWQEFPAETKGRSYELNLRRTMEEGVITEFEEFYAQPRDLWLSIQARPSNDGLVLFFRDITERRKREQDLRTQQELLSVVQHTALAATWDFKLASGRLTFGPGSFPLFGQHMSAITAPRELEKIIDPSDLERVRQSVDPLSM